jgi:hypothetical protein
MSFSLIVRRLHLYLAMFLLPWFFMYAISSIPFSHPQWGDSIYGKTGWTPRFDRPYEMAGGDLKEAAAKAMRDNQLEGNFGAFRPNDKQINIYVYDFWNATQVTYYPDEKRLVAKDRNFRWDHVLTGMHARGGFEQAGFGNFAWGIAVDIVGLGFLVWVASGIYMWWLLPKTRLWGWASIGAGMLSFVAFLALL